MGNFNCGYGSSTPAAVFSGNIAGVDRGHVRGVRTFAVPAAPTGPDMNQQAGERGTAHGDYG